MLDSREHFRLEASDKRSRFNTVGSGAVMNYQVHDDTFGFPVAAFEGSQDVGLLSSWTRCRVCQLCHELFYACPVTYSASSRRQT